MDATVWPPTGAMRQCHSSNARRTSQTSSSSPVMYIITLAACPSSSALRPAIVAILSGFFEALYRPFGKHLRSGDSTSDI